MNSAQPAGKMNVAQPASPKIRNRPSRAASAAAAIGSMIRKLHCIAGAAIRVPRKLAPPTSSRVRETPRASSPVTDSRNGRM
jgi:hypothetical protein